MKVTSMTSLILLLSIFSIGIASANVFNIESVPYSHSGFVSEGYSDYFYINLNTGDVISISLTAVSGDPDLYLYKPNGNFARSDLSVGGGSITYTADVSGSWKIRVSGYTDADYRIYVTVQRATTVTTTTTVTPTVNPDPSSEPRYPTDYSNNNDRTHAGRVYPGTTYQCYIGSGDNDYFYFTISDPKHVIIETVYTQQPSADTVISLISSGGTLLATDDDGGTGLFSRIEKDLLEGTYYIHVRGYSTSTTGYYGLRITVSSPVATVTVTTTPPPVTTTTEAPATAPQEQPWYQPIIQPIQDLWNSINSLPESIRTNVEQQISNAVNTTISIFTEPLNIVRNLVVNTISAVAQPILAMFRAIGGIFQGIADTINSVVRYTFGLGGG